MFTYHHMGIPTSEYREGERYTPEFKMYVSGYENNAFRIQWHRYEADSPLHPSISKIPHVAFKVLDKQQALAGKKLIMGGPYYPLEGFQVAFIEEGGAPIEFIQTLLTEEEIMARAEARSLRSEKHIPETLT